MKFLTFIFVLAFVLMPVNSLVADTSTEVKPSYGYENDEDIPPLESAEPTSLRGVSRFLAQRTTRFPLMKCNKYPRICRAKGSPGPDCCKKRCVNVGTDRFNCGRCGNKCRYSEICCKGKCINPMNNKKHCGGCNNKCKKSGSKCVYGMCSYA